MEEPLRPLESDCCGQGCSPCVFDIYEADMKIYSNRMSELLDPSSRLSPLTYSELTLSDVRPTEVDFIWIFRFEGSISGGLGQHVVANRVSSLGGSLTRQYSVWTHGNGYFELLIKIVKDGRFTGDLLSSWAPGAAVRLRGPFGGFKYGGSKSNNVLAFTSGTGLVPLVPILKSILEDDERMDASVSLCASFMDWDVIFGVSELRDMADFCNFSLRLCLSRGGSNRDSSVKRSLSRIVSKVDYCRVDELRVGDILEPYSTSEDILFLICGSKDYEKDVEGHILKHRSSHNEIVKF